MGQVGSDLRRNRFLLVMAQRAMTRKKWADCEAEVGARSGHFSVLLGNKEG